MSSNIRFSIKTPALSVTSNASGCTTIKPNSTKSISNSNPTSNARSPNAGSSSAFPHSLPASTSISVIGKPSINGNRNAVPSTPPLSPVINFTSPSPSMYNNTPSASYPSSGMVKQRPPARLGAGRLPQGVFDDARDGVHVHCLAFTLIGYFVTSVAQPSATRSSHPRSSANRRRRALASFPRSGARALRDHLPLRSHRSGPRADQPTESKQRQRQTVPSGHGLLSKFPNPIASVQPLNVAQRLEQVSDQAKRINNSTMVDYPSLRFVRLLCV
ncbi:hypothetical protein M405DRAFT_864984 [Rhizopogon salebrosus TDB-379]|nr:hypothetical protein M405DRAFT_864984 [Rhizopogon salebrosus TDB-379]